MYKANLIYEIPRPVRDALTRIHLLRANRNNRFASDIRRRAKEWDYVRRSAYEIAALHACR